MLPPSSPVRIKARDPACNVGRIGAEVFLVHDAVMVDDECHHARVRILGRIGNDSKPPIVRPLTRVVVSAAACVGALSL